MVCDDLEEDNDEEEEEREPKMETRTTTAWYTPQIPVNNGPDDYQGLPGLILEVHDGKLTIVCSKIVLNPKEKIDISEPEKGKVVTQEKYEEIMEKKAKEMNNYTIAILSMALALIIFIILQGTVLRSISLFILSATSVALLLPGLLLPMLDIEAKISKLYFTILDKPLSFTNQILFYQSKSISDLVELLLKDDEIKMIFVGILLVMFSIIFPTLKLIATYLYFYSKSFIGNNAVVRFFALKSTKWSMADVMVVSIFMSYLGLDGVVDNELGRLTEESAPINVITMNGTELQVGFFLFLGFVASSFVLSILVEKTREKR